MKKLKVYIITFLCIQTSIYAQQWRKMGINDSPNYKIELKVEKDTFIIGYPIPFTITYINPTDTAWVVERPDSSSQAILHYKFHEGKFYSFQIGMVPPRYDCNNIDAPWQNVIGSRFVIAPHSTYSFQRDMTQFFELWYLVSGMVDLYYTDFLGDYYDYKRETGQKYSNTKTVRFLFTKESVLPILHQLNQTHCETFYVTQTFVLQEIKPDLKLWYVDGRNLKGLEQKDYKERVKKNEEIIKQFELWWEQNKDTKQVEDAIKKINQNTVSYYRMRTLYVD
jgi:hypothetical protein